MVYFQILRWNFRMKKVIKRLLSLQNQYPIQEYYWTEIKNSLIDIDEKTLVPYSGKHLTD